MRGNWSPTSVSTTRLPPIPVRATTTPACSAVTRPMTTACCPSGRARSALNALELAVLSTPPAEDGTLLIDLEVAQPYLPDELAGKRWYDPTQQGYEKQVAAWLARLREEA